MQTTSPSATPPKPKRLRWLKWICTTFGLLLVALCLLLAFGWWWSGQAGSLQRTLDYAARWLPAEQSLQTHNVQGSLRHGGRLEWLRWSSPTLEVQLQAAELSWQLPTLWERSLRFERIRIQTVQLQSTPSPKDDAQVEPLQSIVLPLKLQIPLQIEELQWQGAPSFSLYQIDIGYNYNGSQHDLRVDHLRYAEGVYSGQIKLQAQSPMQLQAALKGQLQTSLPDSIAKTLSVNANVDIAGTLATQDARLSINANAQNIAEADSEQTHALSLNAQAQVRPWQAQPLEKLQADMQHLDVALFWPEGPHTDLSGTIEANTQDTLWQLQTDIRNTMAGPWNQRALPLKRLHTQASFDGLNTWLINQLRVDFDDQDKSFIQGQGRFDAATKDFEGNIELHAVEPKLLDHALSDIPTLSGSAKATSNAEQEVQFQVQLQSTNEPASKRNALSAHTKGTWKAPVLQLNDMQLQAFQAKIETTQLSVDTSSWFVDGNLLASMPGLRNELTAKASPSQGQGTLDVKLSDAEVFLQWLEKLPLPVASLADLQLRGNAQAHLTWSGGWQAVQQRLLQPNLPWKKNDLQLELRIQSPAIAYQASSAQAIELKNVDLALAGTPQALNSSVQAKLLLDEDQFELNTALVFGFNAESKSPAHDLHARIEKFQIKFSPVNDASELWLLQLQAPLSLQAQQVKNGLQVETTAGQITLEPPSSFEWDDTTVQWEPTFLQKKMNGIWAIKSKGKLQGLSLDLVESFNPGASLFNLKDITSDLIFQGSWDIDSTQSELRAHAVLERSGGDIRLVVEDPNASSITIVRSSGASIQNANTQQVQSRTTSTKIGRRVGIEALRLELSAQDNDVKGQLLWSTKRAGNITAQLQSQMSHKDGTWIWPDNAPLSGSIQASLPDIGLWTFLAPPGWRVGGTLEANMSIEGTRQAPDWSGKISANELFIQSVLDGVDLRQGLLRAQWHGTRLNITDIAFTGGEGSRTRILGPSGNLTNAPQEGGTLKGSGFIEYDLNPPAGSSGIRMNLQVLADHLQVLVRADRQISISGELQALLNDGQLSLNGDLTVDRATIILADDSAPTLDDDVHITSAATRLAAQELTAQKQGHVEASKPPRIHVALSLGNDFALQGYGITTRLEGALTVTEGPRITGTIETVNGRYRAWGQSLDVEQGTIRFNGPYSNPSIDIIAIRPNVDIKVGVKVTGNANNPRVSLFSEPEMADAEKLSWILMGRSAASGGADTGLLQQAALALLSGDGSQGNFAAQLGLDEIGFKGPSADGQETAAITIGKRLSRDLYIAYEQSLSGAMGTLYIFYDLSRRLTLRGQTGEQSALDLIYTRTTD